MVQCLSALIDAHTESVDLNKYSQEKTTMEKSLFGQNSKKNVVEIFPYSSRLKHAFVHVDEQLLYKQPEYSCFFQRF